MVSLRFFDRLLPNVNVVPSRFLFPLGLPYPNGSCNKIGFDIELQINVIGIGWFLLPLPLKNRMSSSPAYCSSGYGLKTLDPQPRIRECLGDSRIRREERILRAS